MTSSRQSVDEAGRKRHLEALFADEPFLSPTMKARRMHEKMVESRGRESAAGERPAAPSHAVDPSYLAAILEEPALSRSDRSGSLRPKMSLEEAKKRLGGQGVPDPFAFTPSDPLSYFRTQVLSEWFQKVDRREIG